RSMAAGCEDNTVKVWDTQTLAERAILPELIYVVVWTRDSKHLLASTRKGEAYWCDLETSKRQSLPAYSGNLKRVICADLSPDRRLAALGHEDGTIQILEVETGNTLARYQGHTRRVRTLEFSPDGSRLVSGGSDRVVSIWDVQRQTNLWSSAEHKGGVC